MMLRIDSLLVLLAASAAMAGLPDAGLGQPATPAKDGPELGASPSERLEGRARKVAERGDRRAWSRAAGLYARAAAARGPDDWVAADDLVLAGHLYFYASDHAASVIAFRTAGQLYLASGRLRSAASAFRQGGWVADRAGLTEEARELCVWAELLTRPQPQEQQRPRRPLASGWRS